MRLGVISPPIEERRRLRRGARRLLQAALVMLCVAAGCRLDESQRIGCAKPDDCVDGYVCVVDHCVFGTPAVDWTSALTAVYRFEQAPPHLGVDSSGHGYDLVGSGDFPPVQAHDHEEGNTSAELRTGTSYFASTDQNPLPPVKQAGLTVGGWFLIPDDPMGWGFLISRKRPEDPTGNGDLVLQNPSPGSLVCIADLPVHAGMVRADAAPTSSWFHLVCRFDQDTGAIFVDGSQLPATNTLGDGPPAERPSPMTFGCNNDNCYVGKLDELFYQDGPLSELQIRRIWACGVDGTLCVCRRDDPTNYAECGRANATGCDPLQLGECNAGAP
jgi:hypothetical protein